MKGMRTGNIVLILSLLSIFACNLSSQKNENLYFFLGGLSGAGESVPGLESSNSQAGAVCNITPSAVNVSPGQAVIFSLSADSNGVERSGFTAGLSDSTGDLPGTKSFIAPDVTTRYELSVWEVDGLSTNFSCETTLIVTPAPDSGAPAPSCNLSIDKSSAAYGESITISWSTANAASAELTPSRGVGVLDAAELPGGSRTFPNYYGNTFNLRVWNGDGKWTDCFAALNINTNSPPAAFHSAHVVDPGSAVSGNLIAEDLEGDSLTYKLGRAPAQGTVSINSATGAFTYTANVGASEGDSFTFTVNDGALDSNEGVVRLNLTNAPVCSISASRTNVHPGEAVTFILSGGGAGVERSGFSAGLSDSVGDLPAVKTIIAPDVSTRYALDVWTVDGVWVDFTCEVTLNVTPVPDTKAALPACILNIDKTTAAYGDTITLSWNASNAGTGELTPSGAGGALTGAELPAGSRSFRNYYGESFGLRVWNQDGRWADCGANLKYNPGDNAPPTANDLVYSLSPGASVSGNLLAQDIENDSLTYTIKDQPAGGVLNLINSFTGEFIYQATADASGILSFSFVATDAGGESNEAVVRLQIRPPAGSLDASFGSNGVLITDINHQIDHADAVVVQPNGKIIAAGTAYGGGSSIYTLVRYNQDGTLDAGFGNGGIVSTYVGTSASVVYSLLLQPDGKIIASGASVNGNYQDFSMARFNSDGSLDASFGNAGTVVTDLGPGNNIAYGSALQSDGKIILAGQIVDYGADFGVVRYNGNGSLDSTFGTGGVVRTPVGTGNDYLRDVVIQPDGKIVAGGYKSGTSDRIALVRYNTDGSLDTTFGSGGTVISPEAGLLQSRAFALVLQSDGKLVLAGDSPATGGKHNFALMRFNSNGSLDGSFGSAGMVATDFDSSNDLATALVVQADGKLVAAGRSSDSLGYDFAIARYNLDGSLDTSFGTAGKLRFPVGTLSDFGNALALQPDGKLIMAGMIDVSVVIPGRRDHNYSFGLARINP